MKLKDNTCDANYLGSLQGKERGEISPDRVRFCELFLATFYYSSWLPLFAGTAWNLAQPTAPHLFSSVFLFLLEASQEQNIILRVTAILGSTLFQSYILACLAQIAQLIAGPVILFMFTMTDFVQTRPTVILTDNARLYRCLELLTSEYNSLVCPSFTKGIMQA